MNFTHEEHYEDCIKLNMITCLCEDCIRESRKNFSCECDLVEKEMEQDDTANNNETEFEGR